MRIGLYPRVSTQEQAVNGHSIDEQVERMKKYCEAMGWKVFNIYTDAGFSGADTNRPALQRMIKDVKGGKLDKVLVYKLDRLSRSQKDTLLLIEDVFLKNNVDFVSMSENFDTSTPFGRAMIGILAVFAQLEREQIKERMAMGKYARAKQGKFGGSSHVPIGYDYINGILETNDFEKMQIIEAFTLAAAGQSPYSIAKSLNERGYTHRWGNWNDRSVRRALHAKTYLGYIKFNDEWFKGEHEAFITEELYNAVQKILDSRSAQHSQHNRRQGKATTYLGGFLYCKQCGAKYSKNGVSQIRKNGKKYEYNKFSCNSRTKRRDYLVKDPNCKNKHWCVDELTEIIFGEIKKLAIDPDYMSKVIASAETDERPAIIQKEIKKIEEQINKFMDLYSLGSLPMDVLQERIHELNDKKTRLETDLEEIAEINAKKLSEEETNKIINSFGEVLNRGDFDEIRAVLASLIDRIELDNDDITIHWAFA